MYLPALTAHPDAEVVGVCGRRAAKAQALATHWAIPWVTTNSDDGLTILDLADLAAPVVNFIQDRKGQAVEGGILLSGHWNFSSAVGSSQ